MSNTLTNDIPKILDMGLAVLRENAIMPKLVNRDYDGQAAQKGAVINIPIANDFAVRAVSPNVAHSATGMNDINPTVKTCTLDKWYESPFVMSDKEYKEVQSGVVPRTIESAVASLANQVDNDLLALYSTVTNSVGTQGTTPFATIADAVNARKYLVNNKMPMDGNVFMVIDGDAEANALQLSQFLQVDQSGSNTGITEGFLGRKLGMDWHVDQNIATIAGSPSYVNNLCFHRDAFVLASRPLNDIIVPGSQIAYATDEVTGLTLRLEVSRQNKQTQWSFDILYGVTDLRPELAVKVYG